MRTMVALATAFALATGASADAQPSLPSIVRDTIAASRKDCTESASLRGVNVVLEAGFVITKDINGDGRKDYILDYGKFQCEERRIFCGSAGCLTQVFASQPDSTYAKVLDENVRGVRFTRVKGRPAMLLDLHGSACNRAGVAPCGATLFWNGDKFSPAN
jgi:hypothetical protein